MSFSFQPYWIYEPHQRVEICGVRYRVMGLDEAATVLDAMYLQEISPLEDYLAQLGDA